VHSDVVEAMITTVDRGRFTTSPLAKPDRRVFAVKARELGRKGIVVGDRVDLVGETTASEDTLARIVKRHSRRTVLRRSADDTDPVERVIVANADQLAVVASAIDPPPRPRLIDRAIVAALDGGLEPCLIVTKADLATPTDLLGLYRPLDIPVIVRSKNEPLDTVTSLLSSHVTVLVGHSGVGKSTLVNALVPEAVRATGHVNQVTGRGRHTSTSAVAFALPGGGWVIDTPGIRSFGLAHVELSRFIHAFPDLERGAEECPRGCTHDDEHCALDRFVADGGADRARLQSFRRLLASRAAGETT
jgi:ribosome biogenesis GTPase